MSVVSVGIVAGAKDEAVIIAAKVSSVDSELFCRELALVEKDSDIGADSGGEWYRRDNKKRSNSLVMLNR